MTEAAAILQSLRALEEHGRSLEPLRGQRGLDELIEGGNSMRHGLRWANDLLARARDLPVETSFFLRAAAIEMRMGTSLASSALEACDRAHEAIQDAAKVIEGGDA